MPSIPLPVNDGCSVSLGERSAAEIHLPYLLGVAVLLTFISFSLLVQRLRLLVIAVSIPLVLFLVYLES